MVRLASIAACLLLVSLGEGLAGAASHTPASRSASARRWGWFYPGGALRRTAPQEWEEKNHEGTFTYSEADRTEHYVELYDASRKLSMRLSTVAMYVWNRDEEKWRFVRGGRWDDPRKNALSTTLNANERAMLMTPSERQSFPRLGDAYEVLAPASPTYNCIAWAIGERDRWVWPVRPGLTITFDDFDRLFITRGYKRLKELNYERVPDVEKIVLYAKVNASGILEPTHAARQLPDGSWSSKLGKLPLIRHLHPEDIDGGTYGDPYIIYQRASPRPPVSQSSAASNKSRTAERGKSSPGAGPSPRSNGRSSGSSAVSP